jgi:uncharacterized Zn finger protein
VTPTPPDDRRPADRRVVRTTSRQGFGHTWWGAAWVGALEQRARLDANRLPRGRTYARHARVSDLEAGPGVVTARVHGSRSTPYRVQLRVREFTDAEWARVLDAVSARAGHAAALLDGEITPEIVGDVADAGLDLLPGAGEIGTICSCPDWANPCKHAAAVCYLVADLVDEDPFVVLELRGRTRQQVLAGLRARRGGTNAAPVVPEPLGQPDDGLLAREAWAAADGEHGEPSEAGAAKDGLPVPPAPRERPGRPAELLVDPPPGSEVAGHDLSELATDAAQRAWELLVGKGDGGLTLDYEADLARRAAGAIGTPRFDQMAVRAERSGRSLLGPALAWQHGGVDGVAAAEEAWRPPKAELDAARAELRQLGLLARVRDNRLSLVGTAVQLRLGKDRRWYRFEHRGDRWELTSPPKPTFREALDDVEPAGSFDET